MASEARPSSRIPDPPTAAPGKGHEPKLFPSHLRLHSDPDRRPAGVPYSYRERGPTWGIPVMSFVQLAANPDSRDPGSTDAAAAQRHVFTVDNHGVSATIGRVSSTHPLRAAAAACDRAQPGRPAPVVAQQSSAASNSTSSCAEPMCWIHRLPGPVGARDRHRRAAEAVPAVRTCTIGPPTAPNSVPTNRPSPKQICRSQPRDHRRSDP